VGTVDTNRTVGIHHSIISDSENQESEDAKDRFCPPSYRFI
jgi:hypothetical protein